MGMPHGCFSVVSYTQNNQEGGNAHFPQIPKDVLHFRSPAFRCLAIFKALVYK